MWERDRLYCYHLQRNTKWENVRNRYFSPAYCSRSKVKVLTWDHLVQSRKGYKIFWNGSSEGIVVLWLCRCQKRWKKLNLVQTYRFQLLFFSCLLCNVIFIYLCCPPSWSSVRLVIVINILMLPLMLQLPAFCCFVENKETNQ